MIAYCLTVMGFTILSFLACWVFPRYWFPIGIILGVIDFAIIAWFPL